MRITYVGPVPPMRGGIAQYSGALVSALRGRGHDVRVHSWRAQYPRMLYPGRERDDETAPFAGARFDLAWWDPLSWWRAGRDASRGDALVFPWVTPAQAPPYRTMLAASRAPAVAIVHNPLPHERRAVDVPLTRWVLRRLRGAVVHAAAGAEDVERIAPGLPVAVTPLPANFDPGRSPLPASPPYRLLFLGYVRPYKGLDIAVDALAALSERSVDATLTVAGEFWEPVDEYRRRAAKAGLEGRVMFLPGYASDAGVAKLLASHHVVVAPYRTATQSGIVPLAYAAGRPVVVTSVGGLAEAVADGLTGALAPPGDAAAFAEAIQRVLADLPAMAAAAAARAASWTDVADAVVALATAR